MVNSAATLDRALATLGYQNTPGLESMLHTSDDAGRQSHLDKIRSRTDNIHSAFFIGNHPQVYFATARHRDDPDVVTLRKLVWNDDSAPILFVATENELLIYDTWAPPRDIVGSTSHLIQQVRHGADFLHDLSSFSRIAIESGTFKSENTGHFTDTNRCQESLISNLISVYDSLSESLDRQLSLRLVLRSILILQLEHRGLLSREDYQRYSSQATTFVELLRDHEATYQLFDALDLSFNGDLLHPTEHERVHVSLYDLERLGSFLSGEELLPTGQGALWPLYDFAVIPVKLLSAAYERLLRHIDSQKAHSEGVFYTPPELVDLVLDEVLPWPTNRSPIKRSSLPVILDPACGSGVFLVEAFHRLVAYQKRLVKTLTVSMCRDILVDNIFGIDINEEAVDVTAFSLNIAFLDVASRLDGDLPRFPKLRPPSRRNLLVADALTIDTPSLSVRYDLIVGNPPWKRVGKPESETWPKRWGRLPLQKATAFVQLARELAPDGTIALVLPAKWMFNREVPDSSFRADLFGKCQVILVANLAAFTQGPRKLFRDGHYPASVVIFRPSKTDASVPIRYWVPLPYSAPNRFYRNTQSEFSISQKEANSPAIPQILKSLYAGGPRHTNLVRRLFANGPNIRSVLKSKQLFSARGLQVQLQGPNAGQIVPGVDHYLPADWPGRLRVPDTSLLSSPMGVTSRLPDLRIFYGPRVLIKKSVTAGRLVASYLERPAWFSDNFTAISGPPRDADFLRALTAYLNSNIIAYLIMTSSSTWGIDRTIVNKEEVLDLPASPLTDEFFIHQASSIVSDSLMNVEDGLHEIDFLVMKHLDLSENENSLVEEMLTIRTPRLLGGLPQKVNRSRINKYLETLISVLSPLTSRSNFTIECDLYLSNLSPLALISLSLQERELHGQTIRFIESPHELTQALTVLENRLSEQKSQSIYQYRNFFLFTGNSLRLTKALDEDLWTVGSALDDADRLVGALFQGVADNDRRP